MANKTVTVELSNLSSGSNASASSNGSIVSAFGGEDTLSLVGGSITDSVIRGDDVVLTVNGNFYLRVKNAKGRYLNVVDESGAYYQQYGGSYS
ncbi:MAG: hypothetical protein IJU71_08300, partial [Selenomonadaceae bacterium]|nr:hypothetical protein [Selenomonadaceae bacterium]